MSSVVQGVVQLARRPRRAAAAGVPTAALLLLVRELFFERGDQQRPALLHRHGCQRLHRHGCQRLPPPGARARAVDTAQLAVHPGQLVVQCRRRGSLVREAAIVKDRRNWRLIRGPSVGKPGPECKESVGRVSGQRWKGEITDGRSQTPKGRACRQARALRMLTQSVAPCSATNLTSAASSWADHGNPGSACRASTVASFAAGSSPPSQGLGLLPSSPQPPGDAKRARSQHTVTADGHSTRSHTVTAHGHSTRSQHTRWYTVGAQAPVGIRYIVAHCACGAV